MEGNGINQLVSLFSNPCKGKNTLLKIIVNSKITNIYIIEGNRLELKLFGI